MVLFSADVTTNKHRILLVVMKCIINFMILFLLQCMASSLIPVTLDSKSVSDFNYIFKVMNHGEKNE